MFSIWVPNIPDSIDGDPLLTNTSQLLPNSFPYDRLIPNSIVSFFLQPSVVFLSILLYILSERPVAFLRDNVLHLKPNNALFRTFIILHNMTLAIFSAACAYNSWAIVISHLRTEGFFNTYCDPNGTLWRDAGLGPWSIIFYLSKYYELVDTWILVLKGKGSNFLQVYHHSGIILCMYLAVLSQSAWLLFVVLLNSVIHTMMYTYFALKTIAPRVQIRQAKYLTMAQIGQFFTGILSTLGILYMGDECDTQSSRMGLWCLQFYGYGLIALFLMFANKKYAKKEKNV